MDAPSFSKRWLPAVRTSAHIYGAPAAANGLYSRRRPLTARRGSVEPEDRHHPLEPRPRSPGSL